jgi:hypothetical protein
MVCPWLGTSTLPPPFACVCVRACVCACVRVCVRVCGVMMDKKRERGGSEECKAPRPQEGGGRKCVGRETASDRERERERVGCVCVYPFENASCLSPYPPSPPPPSVSQAVVPVVIWPLHRPLRRRLYLIVGARTTILACPAPSHSDSAAPPARPAPSCSESTAPTAAWAHCDAICVAATAATAAAAAAAIFF